jgi:hypothetical protein
VATAQLNVSLKQHDNFHKIKIDAAQNIEMNFSELLENNQQLPVIIQIYQTKDNLLWLVTDDDGIIEYNSTTFTHYRNLRNDSLSLPSNRVTTMFEENGFIVWVGTKTGICKFDRVKKQFIPFYFNNMPLAGGGFLKTPDGRLLCGTSAGLCVINKINNTLIPFPNQRIKARNGKYFEGETIQSTGTLLHDKEGKLWSNIVTQNLEGLASFDFKLNEWTFYPHENLYPQKTEKAPHSDKKIVTWCIYADEDEDRIWAGGYGTGLRCYSKSKGTWQQFYFENGGISPEWSNAVLTIFANNKNELLVGTYEGLRVFNKSTLTVKKYIQAIENTKLDFNSAVHSITTDNCGNLWLGGAYGLVRLHRLNNRFVPVDRIVGSPLNIQSFLQLKTGNFIINDFKRSAAQNNICEIKELKLKSRYDYLRPETSRSGPVIKFEMTSQGKLVTFSKDGIASSDTGLKKFQRIPITLFETNGEEIKDFTTEFYSVVKWNDSIYYACRRTTAELGFIKININTKIANQYKPFGNSDKKLQPVSGSIHWLYKDCYDRLWCCSDDRGLSIFYPSTNTFEHYFSIADDKTSLPANLIRCVYQTSDKTFWISTNAGLCRAKALPGSKAAFEVIVPDIECNFLYEDNNGYLWVNFKNGTFRLNIKTLAKQFYNETDGYNWDGYYAKKYLLPNGNFLMPDGLIFDPSALPRNQFKPVPSIYEVKVYNDNLKADSSFPFKKNIHLNHNQNFISISYTSDSYVNEEKNTYSYKLEGVDTGWVQAGSRTTAFYTQLQPGTYNFWVKASNNDGLQGLEKHLLTIVIIPAWHQTWWFRTLCILTGLAIVYTFYRQKLNQEKAKALAQSSKAELKHAKAEFEKQIAETEMIALRAQMNPHFIFNVLNSINKYILVNEGENASHYLTQFSRLIRLVLENSKSSKISLGADLQALQLYINMEELRFGNRFSYNINVQKNIDTQFVQVPPLLIQPYVENAIWHGLMQQETKGCLDIIITHPHENLLQIVVQDNGIGRKKAMVLKSKSATKHKSFGMQITKDRINIVNKLYNIQATVEYEDIYNEQIPAGTRVTLTIPV